MKLQNPYKNYLNYEKGRYAHSTDRRRLVWEDIVWPLITDLEKPYFTLKEYQEKRDAVGKNKNITPRQISGGFISLVNKGILIHQEKTYSIHYNLIPYINNKGTLDYGTVLRETHKKVGKPREKFLGKDF